MRIVLLIFTVLFIFFSFHPAEAILDPNNEDFAVFDRDLTGKAAKDECFYGIGSAGNTPLLPGLATQIANGCPGNSQLGLGQGELKVNQAYIWGLTQGGDNLWFGTMSNTNCLVEGGFLGFTRAYDLEGYQVCEFGSGKFGQAVGLPAMAADWRPPQVWRYDQSEDRFYNMTPPGAGPSPFPLTANTLGFRSASTLGDIILLAGPALSTSGGMNVFAYNATTNAFIGWQNLPQFKNIRRWITYNGVLYTAVQNADGTGSVLRWKGYTATGPGGLTCDFEVVGNLDADGAEIVVHNKRLYVGTWPSALGVSQDTMALAGLWMSPAIPSGGLTAANAAAWKKVWAVNRYEPDQLVAYTYGMGAMASFNGYLYFGTMHVPQLAFNAFRQVYGMYSSRDTDPAHQQIRADAEQNTERAVAIFRSKGFEVARPVTELLYGEAALPMYIPGSGEPNMNNPERKPTGSWITMFNGMLKAPRYGHSGINNMYNNYTWGMAVHDNQLFVGTMDSSMLLDMLGDIDPSAHVGADLYRFLPKDIPGIPESLNGVGNEMNYGVRNMLSSSAGLYVGTANPMNLNPEGGWELLRLNRGNGVFPVEGSNNTALSIAGTGFGKTGTLLIGTKRVVPQYWSDNYLYVKLPSALAPGTYTITIKRAGKTPIVYSYTVPS